MRNPPPAPQAQGLKLIYAALLVLAGPLIKGIAIWADRSDTTAGAITATPTVLLPVGTRNGVYDITTHTPTDEKDTCGSRNLQRIAHAAPLSPR